MTQFPTEPPEGTNPAGQPGAGSPGDLPEPIGPPEDEIYPEWPDEDPDPWIDVDAWLAKLSPAEREAVFEGGFADDHEPDWDGESADTGFSDGGPLDGMPPGPVLAALSQGAIDSGFLPLSDDELVGLLRASRRLSSWQAAVELRAISELDSRRLRQSGRPGASWVSEHISSELAAALTLTGRAADSLLGLARDLARLPAVLRALADGRIDRAKAVVFANELAGLNDVSAAAVAAAFCDLAESMTTGQLRAALRSMVLSIDPAALRRRAEKARADARVETWREGSGNAALAGRELPPADAIAADRRIAAIAKALKEAGAPGTMDQLRAAVYVALLTGRDPETLRPAANEAPSSWPAPREQSVGLGLSGSVNLTMPMSAWLGGSDSPGEIAGLGPFGADTCRDLAARLAAGQTTRWCVTLTGSDGRAVAHACGRSGPGPPGGPRDHAAWLASLKFAWLERGTCSHSRQSPGYRPPSLLCTLVKIRQRTCCFPGCRRPAVGCDLDHTIPYDQGGRSCECNLAPLCRRHHQVKQATDWRLEQPSPGVMVWHLPHGRTYQTAGEPYPV
jgi:hypothetical protein